MRKIKIVLDDSFPYNLSLFEKDLYDVKKVSVKLNGPASIRKLLVIVRIYLESFNNNVIIGSRRTVLFLALLFLIYKPKNIKLIGYEIIFNLNDDLRDKFVKLLWQIAIKKVDKLIVQSEDETKYLKNVFITSIDKFETIPFYTDNKQFIGSTDNGYVFAAGRMERDFVTLIEAVKDTDIHTIIIAEKSQEDILKKSMSDNIHILYEVSRAKYEYLLREAKLVVVPLKNGIASRGQSVILEAMGYGKPVISSKVTGTINYLIDGYSGFFVEAQNISDLQHCITKLFYNKDLLADIGTKAYREQRSRFSFEIFSSNYNNLLKKLISTL